VNLHGPDAPQPTPLDLLLWTDEDGAALLVYQGQSEREESLAEVIARDGLAYEVPWSDLPGHYPKARYDVAAAWHTIGDEHFPDAEALTASMSEFLTTPASGPGWAPGDPGPGPDVLRKYGL
jgi:hypothetical protein